MMSEIQSLTEQVQHLSGAYGWWSRASQVFIGATAFVAVLYFVSSGIALKRANALQEAQNRLSKAKDDQLTFDLKDKEEKIAIAKSEAGKANKSAGEANKAAADANERASNADERAGKANERAGELEKEGEMARLKQEELRQQNLATEKRLAEEQDKRLELEKSLAPRQIPFRVVRGKSNIDPLRPFAGTGIVLKVLPDAEAARAASNVAGLLSQAGWKILSIEYDSAMNIGFFDGVVIETYTPPRIDIPFTEEQEQARERSRAAAETVVDFLKSNDWQARAMPGAKGEIPANAIKVSVGVKASPYFDAPEIKRIMKELDETMRRIREERERETRKP